LAEIFWASPKKMKQLGLPSVATRESAGNEEVFRGRKLPGNGLPPKMQLQPLATVVNFREGKTSIASGRTRSFRITCTLRDPEEYSTKISAQSNAPYSYLG
jgi:hypothetical protein